MRNIVLGLILAGLPAAAANRTGEFTGVITETMCGNNHKMMKISPDSKCVQDCVKGGYKYALVEGSNVYPLSDQAKPAPFAGQKVKIKGTLFEKTRILKLDSIEAAK